MTLMEIRNQQFELLLLPIGGVVPLVSAMRRGKSHTEVQIVLTGAFSRRVSAFESLCVLMATYADG